MFLSGARNRVENSGFVLVGHFRKFKICSLNLIEKSASKSCQMGFLCSLLLDLFFAKFVISGVELN